MCECIYSIDVWFGPRKQVISHDHFMRVYVEWKMNNKCACGFALSDVWTYLLEFADKVKATEIESR